MPEDEKNDDKATETEADEETGQKEGLPPLPAASFSTFLQGLAGQCLIALGAIENPMTGKREPDLQQAKYSIDLMQIMEEKTKGNLDDDEDKRLQQLLYDLRMRYVEACRT